MKQRRLEEVKALSVEEAVEIMRQAGIVGAGGGGFPTYVNTRPTSRPEINANESETGYGGGQTRTQRTPRAYFQVCEARKTISGSAGI